jgi:hypothetical protein
MTGTPCSAGHEGQKLVRMAIEITAPPEDAGADAARQDLAARPPRLRHLSREGRPGHEPAQPGRLHQFPWTGRHYPCAVGGVREFMN